MKLIDKFAFWIFALRMVKNGYKYLTCIPGDDGKGIEKFIFDSKPNVEYYFADK